MIRKKEVNSMKNKKWIGVLLLVLVLTVIWLIWGNTALEVTRIEVSSEALPASFDGFRIAHVSDLHNAEFGEDNAQLLAMLRELEPDIIAITGDLVDSRRTNLDAALTFVREAVKIAPCYYVTGNHEARISDFPQLESGLKAAGVTVLRNETVTLEREGEIIRIIGMEDYSMYDYVIAEDSIANILEDVEKLPADGYTILLCHRPELCTRFSSMGYELMLSGHAHGGQIRIPFVGGLVAPDQGFFPKYDAGLYNVEDMSLVVSRGLGNSIIPLRVNNRPEVVLITLTVWETN